MSIHGHCRDCFSATFKNQEYNGYVSTPDDIVGSGDDVEFDFCLECGKIQAEFPVRDPLWACSHENIKYIEHDGVFYCSDCENEFINNPKEKKENHVR
jgi:hypothetical protein